MYKPLIEEHIKRAGSLAGFQRNHGISIEDIKGFLNFQEFAYFQYHELSERPTCICGVPVKFRGFATGYMKYCKPCAIKARWNNYVKKENLKSKPCLNCSTIFTYKNRKTDHKFCSKSCACTYMHNNMSESSKNARLTKIKQTNLKKYGNEWVVNSEYTKDKTTKKLGYRYAFQSPDVIKKSKETLFAKTGYYNPLENPDTVAKMINTKMDKYGDLLSPCYNLKEYVMPSGIILKIQGHENLAIDYLLKTYDESDIITGRKNIELYAGKISYMDSDNIIRTYYPDVYIKSTNTVIEVKSQYTHDKWVHKLANIKEAIKKTSLDFKIMIFSKKEGLIYQY